MVGQNYNDFNVNNPTNENIEYAFKNLFFNLAAATNLKLYKTYRTRFEQIFEKVMNVFDIYVNSGNLYCIDEDILIDINYELLDLEVETQTLKSYYAEWSHLWLEAIISLRESENRNGGNKNGR